MDFRPGLVRTLPLDVSALRREAGEAGYSTFVLPADGVTDQASFFSAVRSTLPLDPPVIGSRSWDALGDSLWSGLHALPEGRIAIFWPNAQLMAGAAVTDFDIALKVLGDTAVSLADPVMTNGKAKQVTVIVGA